MRHINRTVITGDISSTTLSHAWPAVLEIRGPGTLRRAPLDAVKTGVIEGGRV